MQLPILLTYVHRHNFVFYVIITMFLFFHLAIQIYNGILFSVLKVIVGIELNLSNSWH